MPNHPLRLHRHPLSGHCHRVEVFLRLIGQDFESLDVDLAAGAHKQPGFLALNAFGEVPVLEHGDIVLADSNAILVYLARTLAPDWYPEDPLTQARIQRFLSMAAGDIAFGPAAARLITVFGAPLDADRAKSVAVRVSSAWRHIWTGGAGWSATAPPSPISPSTAIPPMRPKAASPWPPIRA